MEPETLRRRPKSEAELRSEARRIIASRPPPMVEKRRVPKVDREGNAIPGQFQEVDVKERQLTEDELVADAKARIEEDVQKNSGTYASSPPAVDEVGLAAVPRNDEPFGGIASTVGAGKNPLKSPIPSGVSSQVGAEATASNALEGEQTPQGREMEREALAAALAAGEPRVIGYTKPGFQPKARGGVVQTEQKILPPGYNEAVEEFGTRSRVAAEGLNIEQTEIKEALARSAQRRKEAEEDFRIGTEEAAEVEAATLGRARDRIQIAIEEYQASGPRFESLGTVLKEAPSGKGVFGGIGLFLGMLGGAASGRGGNAFVDAVNGNINRRARIAEEDSKRKGARVSMEGAQYAKMERAIGDAQATRSLIKAMYLDEYKEDLVQQMQRIGVGAENPRLQQALAAIALERAKLLKETAGVMMQRGQHEEQFVPSRAIMSKAAGVGLTGKRAENLKEYLKRREDNRLPESESGIRLMERGSLLMSAEAKAGKGGGFINQALLRLVAANPERWREIAATSSAMGLGTLTPGQLMFLNGVAGKIRSYAGKATTLSERAGTGTLFGDFSETSRQAAIAAFQTEHDELEGTLRTGYEEAYRDFRLLRAFDETEPRKLHDVSGVEHAKPVTEQPPRAETP